MNSLRDFMNPIGFEISKLFQSLQYLMRDSENTSISKSECIEYCQNFWLPSLPSVIDFEKIKNEFVPAVNVQNLFKIYSSTAKKVHVC